MTTNPSVTTESDAKPGAMTQANCAHLFRAIEHAITYDGLVSPTSVYMQPEFGYAMLQFAADDVATVQEWAARTGSTVVHGGYTYTPGPWYEFGTRPGGREGLLAHWRVDLWCKVNGPSPSEPAPVEVDEPPALADAPLGDPQTQEIKARYLAAGMTVIDGTDGPLVVTVVNRYAADTILVYFEGQPEPTQYGPEVGVTVAADDAPAGA